tara:strand:- start:101 stop:505 length:405 start_codon:yes stop_codon:yes gene_type:complete
MSSLSELATRLKELRDRKTELKNQTKEVQTQLDAVEAELLEEMSHEGMHRLDLSDVGSFHIASRKFYKIADREALMDFLHEQGDVDLLTVNHQTLNAYAKEIAARKEEQGVENFVVPGVEFTERTQIRVRKPRR